MKNYFATLARYNAWATRKLYEHVDSLSEDDYRRDAGLFFTSVHGTLNHLLVGHLLWFRRFAAGESPRVALNEEVETDRARLRERLIDGAQRWLPLIESLADSRWTGKLDYTSTKGVAMSLPFAPTLGHVYQPRHPPPRPDHCGDHRDGPPVPRDRPGLDAAGGGHMSFMSYTTLDVQRPSAHVARVFLNRPEMRNAFNETSIAELAQAFSALSQDSSVRAIVLGGHGKAFCAGGDLKERAA